MSREVLLIRHAESEMNLTPEIICGRSNHITISPTGEAQADMLGRYLGAHKLIPTKVLSSPALRTRQTAEGSLSAMGLNLEIEIEDAVQELDQGEWEGLPRDQIYTPELTSQINAMNGTFRAPGGESPRDVARRMYAALETHAVAKDPEGPIHIYTHGFAIRSLVGHLNGWSHRQVIQSVTDNTSITRLEYDDTWIVSDFARIPELS